MQRIFLLFIGIYFINTQAATACDRPFLLTVDSITSKQIKLDWYVDDSVSSFQIDVQVGSNPPSSQPLYSGITESEFKIQGLIVGTFYTIYVRSICGTETSEWVSIQFRTAFNYKNNCFIYFPIQDNSCQFQGREKLKIYVDSSAIEGLNHPLLKSVSLIIEHPWPSDLKASLISPYGVEIPLFKDLELGYPNLGNPGDSTCSEALVLTDAGCVSLDESTGPFIGNFKSTGSLWAVPSDSLIGLWYLDFCDDSRGDIGIVKSVELTFGSRDCSPVRMEIESYTDREVEFKISAALENDTIVFKYGILPFDFQDTAGFKLDTFYISSAVDTVLTIGNLSRNTSYRFYAYRLCSGKNSSVNCGKTATLLCNSPTVISRFSEYIPLDLDCGEEKLTYGIWYQDSRTGYLWGVGNGATNTLFTGPESSPYGDEEYIFYDASDRACGNMPATLNSSCFYVPVGVGSCSMSFDYSMYGDQISRLLLLVNADESAQWDTLFQREGNQGKGWHNASIDLSPYIGAAVQLQFVAGPTIGGRGDIAIDNIVMMGPILIARNGYLLYPDEDGDNFGFTQDSMRFCRGNGISGHVDTPGDCDDSDMYINPGVAEIPCNIIDDNCNGQVDEVQQDTIPVFTIIDSKNPSCRGISDGYLEIEIENYSDYSLLWNTGDTSNRIESLSAGVYYVDITTSTGCIFRSQFYELKNTSNINALVTEITTPTCIGISDGSITVQSGGGVPPYQYMWNNGASSSVLDSVPSGSYSVTVTDNTGCQVVIDSIVLNNQYDNHTQIDVFDPISCNGGSDGDLIVTLQGASAQSYNWSTGDTSRLIHNLSEGFYTCTITFNDKCTTVTDSFYLNDPDSLYLERLNIEAPTCATSQNGLVITQLTGGTPPYRYRIFSRDTFYVGPVFKNLSSGMYTLKVSDKNNCIFTLDSIRLGQKDSLNLNAIVEDTRCPLSVDGSINTTINGGTAPYSYIWSSKGLDSSDLSGLSPGTYNLTVVDNLGCKSDQFSFLVEQGTETLDVDIEIVDSIYCGDTIGYLSATILNGKDDPVEYNWDNGTVHNHFKQSDTLGPIQPGKYTVTVTDANGCVGISDPFSLKENDTLFYDSILVQDITCLEDSSGRIEIVLGYYNPPIRFDWNIIDGDSIISNLPAGIYQATITDAAGCETVIPPIEIATENPLQVEQFISDEDNGTYDIEVKATGGVRPYSITWQDDTTHSFVRAGVPPGEYYYTVTDAVNCSVDSVIIVKKGVSTSDAEINEINLYPNPTTGIAQLDFSHAIPPDFTIHIYSIEGKHITSIKNSLKIDLSKASPGVYLVEIQMGGRRKLIKLIKF